MSLKSLDSINGQVQRLLTVYFNLDPLMRPKWMLYFAIGSLALWITMFIVLTTFAYRTDAFPRTDLNYVLIGHVDHNSANILIRNTELPIGVSFFAENNAL